MPKTAPVVTEKQWQDVLARLSYLEEQDSQRQDDFYLFQKAVQRVEAKGDDSDQRRRDQLLALQENNVLLLQRFLSCKEEVASNTNDCRRTLDEMREDMEKYKQQMAQFEQRMVQAEERMAAAVCKMKKAKLENKKYSECNKRIIVLYKQLHKLSKRVSASTRGQLDTLNKRLEEHTTRLTTDVKETVGANVLEALQTSTSDSSGKLKENDFLHGVRQYGIDNDNSATQPMDDQGGVGSNNSKWQEMLSFQKGLLSGVANYLNKSMKTQVIDSDSHHHTDLEALETKLNLKFQENYESQLKLLSLKMNRKFEDFGNALIDEVDKRVQENLKKPTETDRKLLGCEIDSCNGKDQECRNCGNYRKKELQAVVEKYARRVCSEQKVLIQAELDQKLQMHIKSGLGSSLNVKKKFEEFRKTLLEDMEKQGQGIGKKQAETTDKEMEVHEGSVQIVNSNNSPNEKEKQESPQDRTKVGQKVLLKDVEKHAREVCNEQKILLQAEIDQKIQMHMKKQSGLGYAWEKRVENLCMDTTQALMNKTIEELTDLIRKMKEELTDLCLSTQNFTTQEINATLEDNVQECSNYLQIEMNDLLVECAKAQTKDLQESVVKESEKIKVSLSESLHQSMVEKIKEVNENQQTGFQTEMTKTFEEKIETRVKKLLAEVDRKIECAGECLLKSALSYIDQIIRESGISHLGTTIKKDVEGEQDVKDTITQQDISWGKGVQVVKDGVQVVKGATQQESSWAKGVQVQVSDESTTQKTFTTSTAQPPMAGQGYKSLMSVQCSTDSGQTHHNWQQQQQQQQLQLQQQQQQQQQQYLQQQLQQQLQLQQEQQGSDSGGDSSASNTSISSSISAALTTVLTPTPMTQQTGKKFVDKNEKTISMLRFEAEIYRKIQNATQAAEHQMEVVNSRLAQFQQEMISRAQVMHNNLMRCDAQDRNISSLNLRLRVVEVIVQQHHGGRVQPPTPLIQWN